MTAAISVQDPERRLALAYASRDLREGLALLWALDEQMGAILASVRDPMLAELRLAWWREALEGLARGEAQVDPILRGIARLPVDPEALARLADGWIALLGDLPLENEAIRVHAAERGGVLFGQAVRLLGGNHDGLEAAGEAWALVDLAARISDAETAAAARCLACEQLAAVKGRWPRTLRPLAVLTALARRDATRAANRQQGAPGRLLRAIIAGISGY